MKVLTSGFKPFTIVIETEDEAKHLLASLNTSVSTLRGQIASSSLLRDTGYQPKDDVMYALFNGVNEAMRKMI